MVKKKVDPRIRGLIENGVRKNHRSLFLIVGDHGKDQVENIHKILSKTRVKSRPSVLWCYKKELGFSTHRQKRMKEIKKMQARGLYDAEKDDPFELFISSTDIRWTYYKESDKILGQTFGMCVLQDFEALTPNLLARTIETVEGGGIVIILLKTVKSLKQLYTMTMDVHSRFRTEAHHEVIPRFNERFILSLGDCHGCLVLDDELNILPISSNVNYLPSYDASREGLEDGDADASGYYEDPELKELKLSLSSTPFVGSLVEMTKTLDQAKAVMSFLDAISEKTLRSTVSLTAGRGRGKSAAIGLCLAGSVAYGYSNIFITAPSPENLKTSFEFIISGLKALKYVEHLDFEIIQDHIPDVGKVVTRINIFRNHRQTIQYISPNDHVKLSQAELVAIDEAAAIPLPTVKKLMGNYLVFLSSTINGYEGTGRSLSLKLLQQLRAQQGASAVSAAQQAGGNVHGAQKRKGERKVHEERWKVAAESAANFLSSGATHGVRSLVELTLNVPIRYSSNDPVEKWLNNLLCLDVTSHATRIVSAMPAPKDCELYVVDRDALFSYHELSEAMLQRIWALYTSAHYKNSPNDLQILSDAPAHRLFVLLGPQRANNGNKLPDILCVVQVAFEGKISQKSVQTELAKGNKASGDLIPWTIAQQFNDSEFATLSGARIVRISTHPDVQKMGYGSRAVDLLISYFQGELTRETLSPAAGVFGGESSALAKKPARDDFSAEEVIGSETIAVKKELPPLLTPISDRPAERLHYLGVSFGLTSQLLSFWSRKQFKVCYVRQTANDLTGEHSSIVLRELDCADLLEEGTPSKDWLSAFVADYRSRIVSLLGFNLNKLEAPLALTLLDPEREITSAANDLHTALLDQQDTDNDALSNTANNASNAQLTAAELLTVHMSYHDLKRLELYSRNMVDHHMILDLVPTLAKFLFQRRLGALRLSTLQAAVLVAVGLQHRDVDSISAELDLPANQILAFFNKTVRKVASFLRALVEQHAAKTLTSTEKLLRIEKRSREMVSVATSLSADQREDAEEFRAMQEAKKKLLMSNKDLRQHQLLDVDDDQLAKEVSKHDLKQLEKGIISIPKTVIATKEKNNKEENSAKQGKNKKRKLN